MNSIEKLKDFPFRLILASASPRRQQLLRDMGFSFEVMALATDEGSWPPDLQGGEIPLFLAEKKAGHFPRSLEKNELLVTADTIVWKDGKIYNKPVDFEEGKSMLSSLSGGRHQVFTAVCLKSAAKKHSFVCTTHVTFRKLEPAEIDYYLTVFRPYDKAGSYGVQDWLGYVGIERIEGSFYNVMGLPLHELYLELLKF